MNRRGSKNISAIEDRIISQTERAAAIRAEAAQEAQEAQEREERYRLAASTITLPKPLPRGHGSNIEVQRERADNRARSRDDVENRRVNRDPCPLCGTRADRHTEFGCKRWRPM